VNGFGFVHPDAQGMLDCLDQALSIYAQPVAQIAEICDEL